MKRALHISARLLTCGTLCLASCDEPSAGSRPAHAGSKGAGAASKPSGAASKPGGRKSRATVVAVAQVTRGGISSFYETTATLESERTAPILARAKGIVQALYFEEGDTVKKGQVLVRIEDADLKLRLVQAEAKTAGLKDRFQRLEGMVAKKLVPAEELETTRHDLRSAQATEDLARLELSRTRVRAPFAGRVVRRHVEVGQTVSDSTPVFDLADLDPLLARVYVPSKELKRIAQDQPVQLILDSSGAKLEGRIKLISPVIDASTGTIKVTVEISKYPEGTRPGDFAQVRIVTEQRQQSLLAPRSAVIDERGIRVVFVAEGDKAIRKVVKVGFEQDDMSEILSGLSLGESVVIKGQHSIKDGQPIKIIEN